MADEPTILFSAGATKSGTTWLYRYLHGHPDCALPEVKELHYFDSLSDDGDRVYFEASSIERSNALRVRATQATNSEHRRNLLRQADTQDRISAILADPADQEAAYRALLMPRPARLHADITPAYGLLAPETLARMSVFAANARFVLLMRDPVERLWSHVRAHVSARLKDGEDLRWRTRILIRSILAGSKSFITDRGDYASIWSRLTSVVPANRLLPLFMEELVRPGGSDALCDFLGIRRHSGEHMRVENPGTPLRLRPHQRATLAQFLADQYSFAETTFGPLPDAWAQNRMAA